MQVRAWLRCAVATIDSNSCSTTSIIVSQTLPLSFNLFLPFLTSIELHQEMFTSSQLCQRWSNECQITKPTDELFITAYACPDWLTAPFLSSINTDCQTTKFMKLGECQNCFHKHVSYCVSCDEFCQVQYIIVIESVTVLSSTCCSVPGYLYDHTQGVCFLPLLYKCNSHSQTLLYIHKHTPLKIQTVCSM